MRLAGSARALACLVVLASPAGAQAAALQPNKTYDAVVEGMSCRQHPSGRLDCSYRVGDAVRFAITGVGQDDAVVSFVKVDSSAGFVAGFAALHGCVVVKPAAAGDSTTALAFVSPRDGKVYRVWQLCRQTPRR